MFFDRRDWMITLAKGRLTVSSNRNKRKNCLQFRIVKNQVFDLVGSRPFCNKEKTHWNARNKLNAKAFVTAIVQGVVVVIHLYKIFERLISSCFLWFQMVSRLKKQWMPPDDYWVENVALDQKHNSLRLRPVWRQR